MANNYFTTAAVAERLSISVDQVIALIHSRRIAAVNVSVGRKPRWRIAQEDLETFLAAAAAKPTTQRRARKVKQPAEVIEFF